MALFRPHELEYVIDQRGNFESLRGKSLESLADIYLTGDVSEQADLPVQKRREMIGRRRQNELNQILANSRVVNLDTTDTSKVQVGSYIKFENLNGDIIEKTLSGPSDAAEYERFNVYIDVNSPRGSRLLGRRKGDEYLIIQSKDGFDVWTIVEIRTDTDALFSKLSKEDVKKLKQFRQGAAKLYQSFDEIQAEDLAKKLAAKSDPIVVKADLFSLVDSVDAIGFTSNGVVNKSGLVMGAGVAKQFKDRYPSAPRIFGQKVKDGGNFVYFANINGQEIFSFPTKQNFKDPSDLSLIVKSAMQLMRLVERKKYQLVAVAFPGIGKGALDPTVVWDSIKPFLDERVILTWKSSKDKKKNEFLKSISTDPSS